MSVVLALLLPTALPAYAGPGESTSVSRVQSARAANSRAGYAVRSDLVAVARRHAARMAARGEIFHNGALASEVSGWHSLGENVGRGADAGRIHAAFMDSSSHRGNILSATFTEIGVGTAVADSGELFLVQVFRRPKSAARSSRPTAPATRRAAPPPPPAARKPRIAPRATRSAPRAALVRRRPDPTVLLARRLGRLADVAAATPTAGAFERAARFDWVMDSLVP